MRPNRSPRAIFDVTQTARTRAPRAGWRATSSATRWTPCALAVAAAIAATLADARAADAAPRVVVVDPPASSAFARDATKRVRAELAAAGFDAVAIAPSSDDARAAIEGAGGASSDDTVASIALEPVRSGTAIDVWVHDGVTGKSLVRRISVGKTSDAARVVAIRAIELLRASLLEATTPMARPPEAPPPPPPPPEVAAWVTRPIIESRESSPATRPRGALVPSLAISAGAAALIGVDGLPVAPMPELRLSLGLTPALHTRLGVAGPGFIGDVSSAAGTAVVRQELARLELVYAPPLSETVVPMLAIGAGGYHMHAHGDAAASFRSSSDDAWALLVSAGGGVALRLSSHAAVTLDASALFLAPRPVVMLGDTRVATAGRPSVIGSLGVMASF